MVASIIAHGPIRPEFGQLTYISFLFAARVPSEDLAPQRAYKGETWPPAPPNRHAIYCALEANPDREYSPYALPAEKTLHMAAS